MKNTITITKKTWEGECAYCGQNPTETEIQKAYASGTYICGDTGCWNSYCEEWVWTGDVVEVEKHEAEVCSDCEEDEADCYCCEDEV